MPKILLPVLASAALLTACAPTTQAPVATTTPPVTQPPAAAPHWPSLAETYLNYYSGEYQRLYTASAEAEWRSNTALALSLCLVLNSCSVGLYKLSATPVPATDTRCRGGAR